MKKQTLKNYPRKRKIHLAKKRKFNVFSQMKNKKSSGKKIPS